MNALPLLFAALPAVNPVLPLWECVPDTEPRVFGDRLYVYGSHDRPNGWDFCLDDYVGWSAPLDALGDWKCEGTIFAKRDDPENREAGEVLYAPDVVCGTDGRYYLYYQRDVPAAGDGRAHLGVAVCERPAGRFRPLGYVRRQDGSLFGDRPGDNGFDPSVLVDGKDVWLYCGFAGSGAHVYRLDADMLTILEERGEVVPPNSRAKGTRFEGHAFFEAASVRKIDGRYFLVYSESPDMRTLGYATADLPYGPFVYRGALVRNGGGNNHGGLVCIRGVWYIFYHRMTNGTIFSRKCCAERLARTADGGFAPTAMTSQGLGGAPLPAAGRYPAAVACAMAGGARIEQIGEGPSSEVFVGHLSPGAMIGFRSFDCRGVTGIGVEMRGWSTGSVDVLLSPDAEPLGSIAVVRSHEWKAFTADLPIPDGVREIWLRFRCDCGCGLPQVRSVRFVNRAQ